MNIFMTINSRKERVFKDFLKEKMNLISNFFFHKNLWGRLYFHFCGNFLMRTQFFF